MGFFEKLKQGLSKTRTNIFTKVDRLVNSKNTIDEDFLEQLEEIFLSSDVGVQTTDLMINKIKNRVSVDKYINNLELDSLIRTEILNVFIDDDGKNKEIFKIDKKPYVIMIVGVNGVGKTTSVGKLAYNFKKAGYSVLIAAADTFRAAANEQLETWSKRAGSEIIQLKYGSDPSAVVYNAINSSLTGEFDVVLIDTAGRLHTKVNLMEELKKIKRVVQKLLPGSPNEILLVIDSTTGQNGLNQAKEFFNAIGITGLILTKLDGTSKGGIVLRIYNEMKLPVRFIGVGEQIDDLQDFDKESFVKALLEE